MRTLSIALAISTIAMTAAAQSERIASDFEIAQMEKQVATSRGFEAQLSARLNLGDLRAARNELTLAREEYRQAVDLAARERLDARAAANLSRYANASSYAALANARLGRESEAFALLEETARYASDDAETWNLYASAMRVLRYPRKAVSAARNAVAIASRDTSSVPKQLDLAIYQYALATTLIESSEDEEALRLLETVTATLRSPQFAPLNREVARQEAFEIYSSARGNVAAYVSLLNRAQLRLAALHERRGDTSRAREEYERVAAARSDDVTALTALARLAASDHERDRRFAEAFDANPFSLPLIREYQRYLQSKRPSLPDDATPGARVRRALIQLSRGDARGARATLDALSASFPANEALRALRREAEPQRSAALPSSTPTTAELRSLLNSFERLAPEQRASLDAKSFVSEVSFDGSGQSSESAAPGQTIFESGTVAGVRFRFATPAIFAGTFSPENPLRLTYRILGVTRHGDEWALLLEPERVEVVR